MMMLIVLLAIANLFMAIFWVGLKIQQMDRAYAAEGRGEHDRTTYLRDKPRD